MFHYYLQIGLILFISAVVLSSVTYYFLGWPTLGGYPAVLAVSLFGCFLGGLLGLRFLPDYNNLSRWTSLIVPAGTVGYILLYLFHRACKLYDD